MWLTTSAGHYEVSEAPDDPTRLLVGCRDRTSAQTLVDGVETLCGSEVAVSEREHARHPYAALVSREDLAQWLAFEVRNYVDYDDPLEAVRESRGKPYADSVAAAKRSMEHTTDAWMSDYNGHIG